ncbi:hypothetical protein RBA41_30840 [Massilia sp. CCM 9210]|uniref:hypothetical protein n=1 Tax=Massilia scottii TaxID=3057166 RepID=UPI0027968659|nr:hypothetical protein [Massilia sp. CCM 9210]MDQ1817707.1 hypothetical protein [Massilia sp. CCM 9210]
MNAGKRASIYAILGIGGVGLTTYFIYLMLEADSMRLVDGTKLVFLGAACLMFFASISNLMIAFALEFGRVTEVVGMQSCAELRRDGDIVRKNARIRLIRNLDADNSALNSDQKILIFLAGWRPASCAESGVMLRM